MEDRVKAVSEECLDSREATRVASTMHFVRVEWRYRAQSYIVAPIEIESGDQILVDSPDLGPEVVDVVGSSPISAEQASAKGFVPLMNIYRDRASADDIRRMNFARSEEQEVVRKTQSESDSHRLGMKVIGAYIALDRSKVLITYTADGRVDFRELLKTIASYFHMRIEFRQLFARDAAKLVGGLGVCGLPLCCHSFLTSFGSITIAMAKNQLLPLSISKLSGQCGRLMCCLEYENDMYSKLVPQFPRIGAQAKVEGTVMKAVSLNVLADTVVATDGERYETFTSRQWASFPAVRSGDRDSGDNVETEDYDD